MQTNTITMEYAALERGRRTYAGAGLALAAFAGLVFVATAAEQLTHILTLRVATPQLPAVATVTIRDTGVHWGAIFRTNVMFWGVWFLIGPAIVLAARRMPTNRGALRSVLWLGLGASACTAHSCISALIRLQTSDGTVDGARLMARILNLGGAAELNAAVFIMIAGGIHAFRYYRELETQRLREAELELRLAQAHEQARATIETAVALAPEQLVVKARGRHHFLAMDSIDTIEADGKIVRIHRGSAVDEVREPLSRIQTRLPHWFVRVHRSWIVNVRQIREIQPWFRGDFVIVMKDGRTIVSGRNYRDVVRRITDSR